MTNLSEFTSKTQTKSNLTMTGRMLETIKAIAHSSGIIKIFVSDPHRAEIAHYHHTGTAKMPPRPFLLLSDLQYKRFVKLVSERIKFLLRI
jgi:hypothetical protein